MKLKKTQGYRIHQPLSTSFDVVELGGSDVQKYNSLSGLYSPDREVTPLFLKPQLFITDPDGQFPMGDYTTKLVSVKWTVERWINKVKQENPSYTESETEYDYGLWTVNKENNSLLYKANTGITEIVKISFSASFIDTRRTPAQTIDFSWEKSLSCITENPANVKVQLDYKSKVSLSPFKNRGQFKVGAIVHNGPDPMKTADCIFQWMRFNGSEWVAVSSETDSWYVSGANSQFLTVDQDYIGNIRLRCAVTVKDIQGTYYSPVSLFRRWYGQYDEHLDITSGKYIYDDTMLAQCEVTVENRQGIINNPCRYFDIGIYYPDLGGTMHCVSHTTSATISKDDIYQGNHEFGFAVRELTEFIPLADEDGSVLADDDGNVIFAQFPSVDVEVD